MNIFIYFPNAGSIPNDNGSLIPFSTDGMNINNTQDDINSNTNLHQRQGGISTNGTTGESIYT